MLDGDVLTKKGIVKTLYDPACGTGGMLAVADEYLRELNPDARLEVFGQDWNNESYAFCGSDMLIKGPRHRAHRLRRAVSQKTRFPREKFDYMLANPPFGVEWKPDEDEIRKEADTQGFDGRFGAGLPRINDGSFLFLQHMISKMRPVDKGGTRLAIVFNGSPLFTGDAGSGESEIRRWIIENDWLEAIVAMPDQLFYNTGIFTYVWIVTNRKRPERRGKVQLINAVDLFQKMRKSLGNKRHEIGDGTENKPDHIAEITQLYGGVIKNGRSKVFDNDDFGFRKITVERPLRLSFQATPERIESLREVKAFQNLAKSKKKKGSKAAEAEIAEGRVLQDAIIAALTTLDASKVYKNREAFLDDLGDVFKAADLKVPVAIKKAIIAALSERDESADVCTDKDGNPEPDPELRDYENVPLKEDIREYFDCEVKPHVPDAWIDENKRDAKDGEVGIVGYEIPLTRHFYEYKPPRPLEEIEADIKAIEKDIVRMLAEVTA
jgi:type I restriction enzyme M protein